MAMKFYSLLILAKHEHEFECCCCPVEQHQVVWLRPVGSKCN